MDGSLFYLRHDESYHCILEDHDMEGRAMVHEDWQPLIEIDSRQQLLDGKVIELASCTKERAPNDD